MKKPGRPRVTRKGGASAEIQRSNSSSTGRSVRSSTTEQTSVSTRKRKCDSSENQSPVKKSFFLQGIRRDPKDRKFGPGKKVDDYCWICHKKADEFYCGECRRVYHNSCLKKSKTITKDVRCECKLKTIDGLEPLPCNKKDLSTILLKALDRATEDKKNKKDNMEACSQYLNAFKNWPDVPENKDLCFVTCIGDIVDKAHLQLYDYTGQFFQDVKWIYHNCYILKGVDNEMTLAALKLERSIKQQLADAEACPECYVKKVAENASIDFFTKVCEYPHPIVWAKMKGFPYWPAKCLRGINGNADVRFFGTHDKAVIQLSQVYKISRQNPGGNPKKPKNSIRLTSYEEAMVELSQYITKYKDKYRTFKYYSEKTAFDIVRTPLRRMRQTRSAMNRLEDSRNSDVNENIGESSHDVSSYSELNTNQDRPQLNVSVLNDDLTESKVSILHPSSVPLGKFSKKNNESVAFCQMSFAADEENAGETAATSEVAGESSEPQTQLLEISLNSIEGTPEFCVNVPSTQVLLNNIETAQANNYIYTTGCDESPVSSSAPCVITSTRSLNSIFPNGEIPDAASVNNCESSSDEHVNVIRRISEEVLPQVLPVNDDEIQLVQERNSCSKRTTLVEGVSKNMPLTKTLCQLLLGNKPSIRNHISSFQNLALRFYLMMWLEVNSDKLDMNECKMFHSLYEKLYKSLETYKTKNSQLQKENDELKEKLANQATGEDRKKEILNVVVEAQRNNNIAKIRQMKKEMQKLTEDLKESKITVNIFQELREEEKSKIKDLQSLLKEKENEILDYKKTVEDLENKLSLKNDITSVECQTDDVPNNSELSSDNSVVQGSSSIQVETSARILSETLFNPNYTIEVFGAPNSMLTSPNMFEATTGNIILPSNFIQQSAQLPPTVLAQASSACFMKNETHSESFVSHSSKSKSTNSSTYKQSSSSTYSKSSAEVMSVAKKNYSKNSSKKRK